MNGELFEIMVIRLSHTPSDLSTEKCIKLSVTLELISLDHGLIIESIFLYLDHGFLLWWILILRISSIPSLHLCLMQYLLQYKDLGVVSKCFFLSKVFSVVEVLINHNIIEVCTAM